MKTKVCSKCKIEKSISEFYKNKTRKGGIHHQCKPCCKKYAKKYNIDNSERKAVYNKQYNKINAKRISEQKKEQRKLYPKRIAAQKSKYYQKYKEQILVKDRKRLYNFAQLSVYYDKLKQFEEVRASEGNNTFLEVRCAYCGKWHIPTNVQVKNRIIALNNIGKGECRFYCSKNCKNTCPIFDQKKYPKGFKKATSREVVPLLRQLVLERDDYMCQKCEATTEEAQLHVHHEKSYTLNKIMANDPDNCVTLCKECHKWAHSQYGCKYSDLKCPK